MQSPRAAATDPSLRRFLLADKPALLGIAVALLWWLIDSLGDAFVWHEGTFAREMFPRDMQNLRDRVMISLLFIAFGYWFQRVLDQRTRAEVAVRTSEAGLAAAQRMTHLGSWEWEIATGQLRLSDEEYRLFGFAPGAIPPTLEAFMASIHPGDRDAVSTALQASLSGAPFASLFRVVWPDGTIRFLEGHGEVVHDDRGESVRVIGTSLDVTERTKADAELRRSHEAAGVAYRAKADFLATMSHELRTPLNGVLGFSELLRDTPLSDEQREYVETITTSGESLVRIISEILDFAQLEAGKLTIETVPFDLAATVEEVASLCAAQARPKGIALSATLAPEVPTALRGDPVRLRQVLTNLIGNAVKFTERGEITVRVRSVEATATAALVECSVTDTGIGMTPEEVSRLFQSFSQADTSATRAYEGIGLGLVMAKRLIEMMGGTITLESECGRGTTVRFTARFLKDEAQSEAPRPAIARGPALAATPASD